MTNDIPEVERLFDQYRYSITKYPMTGKEYFIAGYESRQEEVELLKEILRQDADTNENNDKLQREVYELKRLLELAMPIMSLDKYEKYMEADYSLIGWRNDAKRIL